MGIRLFIAVALSVVAAVHAVDTIIPDQLPEKPCYELNETNQRLREICERLRAGCR